MLRLTFAVVSFSVFIGCPKQPEPMHCPNDDCNDGSVVTTCKMSSDCKDMSSPVCNTTVPGGKCVACTASDRGACKGTIPRCDNEQCVACINDTQDCGQGGLCLPSGACAAASNILHVTSTSTKTMTCGDTTMTCSLAGALTIANAMATKTTIKFDDDGPYTPESSNFVVNADVTLDMRGAHGAVLHHKVDGPLLTIASNHTVTLWGGTIEGATGANGDGISCTDATLLVKQVTISQNAGSGIHFRGGNLTISQSTVSSNQGGGIVHETTPVAFDITNTFIYRNGNSGSIVGGASLVPRTGSINRFEFNTVVDNQITDSTLLSSGIICDQASFIAPNNLIVRNSVGGNPNKPTSNTIGACTYPTSTILAMVGMLKFKNPDSSSPDYHLQASSSAIGQATTPSSITVDFDNDPRPSNARDQGADQFKP